MFPIEKEQMVLDNMGLVEWVAGRMARSVQESLIDFDDMVQVGSIGLMKAAENYDPSIGHKFSTYAVPYIRGYMMRERSSVSHIYVPRNVKDMAMKIRKYGLMEEKPEVIAERFGARKNRVRDALFYLSLKTLSYNRETPKGDHETYENLFGILEEENWLMVNDFISTLKPEHQEIIRQSMDGKMLTEIAREWGKCRQSVHAMRVRIQKKWLKYAGEVTRL
jgi:RNA polymerase sigma factor (sigma-70 family)